MFVRKKMLVALVITTILFLMLATQSIQRRGLQALSLALPFSAATPTSKRIGHEPTKPPADLPFGQAVTPSQSNIPIPEAAKKLSDPQRLCGCSSCIADLSGSDWFSQRYDPNQQPVLRDTNNNLDPVGVKWWLGLQYSGTNQTLETLITKVFQLISPPAGDFKPLPTRCRRCAVVGNSGNLLQSGHGNLINSHDFIFRMNKAVTRGYEKDVGNRTTYHIMYPESAVDVGGDVGLILLPFKLRDIEWLISALSTGKVKMTYMMVKNRVNADKDKVLVVNPIFFKYVRDHWTEGHGRYPSTGMLAIIFALHTCDQLSVFGYGANKEGNWHHYWENNRNAGAFRKTGVHNADFETQVIHQLAKEGKISLYL